MVGSRRDSRRSRRRNRSRTAVPIFSLIGHIGSARREFMQSHVISLIDDLSAGCIARRTKVFGDCGLAIGHHGLAGEFPGVDEEPWPSLPGNRRTVMGMPPRDPCGCPTRPRAKARRCRPPARRRGCVPARGARLCRPRTMLSMLFRCRICDRSKSRLAPRR